MPEVRVKGLPAQKAFVNAHGRYILGTGGWGGGKTFSLCFRIAQRCQNPGAVDALVRKHGNTLRGSTLKTLLSGVGNMPPVLPPGSYKHYKADRRIVLHQGGEIIYFGLDDPIKIGSLNLTGCAIDQWEELDEEDSTHLDGRLRVKCEGVPNELYGVCNPSVPSHFLAKWFGLALDHKPRPGAVAVTFNALDNTNNPADYLDMLRGLTGVVGMRMRDGLWVQAEGLVYDTFRRDLHVRARPDNWRANRVGVAVDDGFANPFCVMRGEINGDNRLHVEVRKYESGMQRNDKVRAIAAACEGAEFAVIDPSAAELIDACLNAGIPADKADNSKIWGIDGVRNRLGCDANGDPMMTIDPESGKLIAEMESYRWKDKAKKEEPVKENDHACDALRYLVAKFDAGVGGRVYTPAPKVVLPASEIKSDSAVTIMGRRSAWTAFEGNGSGGFR